MNRGQAIAAFCQWLDEDPIGSMIVDALEDHGIEYNAGTLKDVWLNVLATELSDAVSRAVEALYASEL